jgi:hypothetical protein
VLPEEGLRLWPTLRFSADAPAVLCSNKAMKVSAWVTVVLATFLGLAFLSVFLELFDTKVANGSMVEYADMVAALIFLGGSTYVGSRAYG